MAYGYGPPQGPQWQRPRSRGMSPWVIVLLVFGGGFAVLVALAFISGAAKDRRNTPEAKAEQKKLDDELAQQQAAAAAVTSAEEARFRKVCKLKLDAGVYVPYSDKLHDACHDLVRDGLKVPGSGEFPNEDLADQQLTTDDGCNVIFTSSFIAQNAFGVKVRSRYACTWDPRTANVKVKLLD